MPKVLNDHNGGVTEATFFHHVRAIEELDKQLMSIKAKKAAALKLAKDDGIDKDDLKWAQKQRAMSEEERRASHNRRVAYLRFWRVPVGQQISYLDEAVSDEINMTPEQREEKWTNIGEVAGLEGRSLADVTNGIDPNSEHGRWIVHGWEIGQAKLGKAFKKKSPEPTAAPKPADGTAAADNAGSEKVVPRPEPEVVEAAKRRGRPRKDGGLIYMHDADKRKVYEVGVADARPEGAVAITRDEYEKLKAAYEAAENDEWNSASGEPPAPPASAESNQPPAETPPSPDDDWDNIPKADNARKK